MNQKHGNISPGLILVLVSIPIFIGALDLTVVSAVLPQVIYDLGLPIQTKLDDAAWIVSGYLLAYSAAMTFMGRLSDIYGRRKVYLLALAIFAAGSVMVAVSDTTLTRFALRIYYLFANGRPDRSEVSLLVIIIARMVQAFGGGAMVPVGMALVGDLFPPERRARMLGVIAAVDTAGWVVGHLYGGIVVRYFNWRLIFWLNLPICVLGFLLIALAMRKIPLAPRASRMDWLGAALITTFLAALNIALGSGGDVDLAAGQQAGDNINFTVLWVALVLLAVFIWQQSRSSHPLIELSLFRNRNFSLASLANFLVGGALFIAIANVPLFINSLVAETLEQGAWDSGWLLSALTVPLALAAFPGGWMTERSTYRFPAVLGLVLAILGFGLMSRWQLETTYAQMVPQLFFTGIGLGFTIAPIAAAVVNAAPENARGAASALVLTLRLVGMTVGVSGETTYGLRRADHLTGLWIQAGSSYNDMLQTTMQILMQVIDETFLIAGALCILAIIPAILLKKDQQIPTFKKEQI